MRELAALGVALAVTAIVGLGPMIATRLGVGAAVGFATVDPADTRSPSTAVFAELPAGGVSNRTN